MTKRAAAHSRFLMWVDWMTLHTMSREALAAMLDVSLATIFSWCSGRRVPSAKAARRIEAAMAKSGGKDVIKASEWPRTRRGGTHSWKVKP